MKIFLLTILIFYATSLKCLDLPYSFTENSVELKSKESIDLFVTEIPDIERLLAYEDSLNLVSSVPLNYYGYEYKYELDLYDIGTWENLPNGDRLWRYHIVCPNAFSVNFVFENMNLADNSSLSFYNEDNGSLIGPLDSRINREHGVFSSHTIDGQSIFIELYEPSKDFNKNKFTLSKIVYGYKEIPTPQPLSKLSQIQSSHSCNVDVNCTEGDDFCREKYSVAVVVSPLQQPAPTGHPLWHHCSGSLINNTALDYKPYFLTAEHCIYQNSGGNSTQTILNQWAFKFGYMTETCNSSTYRQTKVYSGADFISSWGATDFALVEMQAQPISGENNFPDVYFSGWDRSNNIPSNTTGIHHPRGDYMKIVFDEDSPFAQASGFGPFSCSDSIVTGNTHYYRTSVEVGTAQHGSSGSPLYNENNHIVGQLKRGCGCDRNNGTMSYSWFHYGRVYHSWDGAGSSVTRLKDWLDPGNTGVMTLDGIKMPNLLYGREIANGVTKTYAAYTDMHIGSSTTDSYRVQSGGDLTLKAGREIKISGCTQIKAGSEFHAYIEDPDCDDEVLLSDKLTDHDPSICSPYAKLVKEDQSFDSPFTGNILLTISPNPVTSISDIKLKVGASDNVSLVLYDNLGNQRLSYLDNISLKSGTYNYKLDGNELNSGMFVLVLKIDDIVITEKVINLK